MQLRLPAPIRASLRPLTARSVIPDRLWWRLTVEGTFPVRVGAGFRYTADAGDVIGRSLYWKALGAWEWTVFREFVPRARRARGFLDIGANTGAFTLVATAVNPTLRAVAFEPSPEPLERLRRHVEINDLAGRVTVAPVALSDRTGTSRFFVPDGQADMSFLEGVQVPTVPGRWVEVPTVAAAEAVPADFPVDLVKIDVENAEGAVMEALRPVLAEHRPTLVVEMLPEGSHVQARRVLAEAGYRVGRITTEGVDWSSGEPAVGDPNNFLCEPV